MAYNKSKLVANAQKLLHQGKVAQAIQEYIQILKQEPKDQATLMTLGDLYVRQGDTFQALEYFERLAQFYLSDGFVTKAIAVYKKISKLAPEETHPFEKLAELYVQQGVLSEARPIYLQLAELHQRAGRQPQAAALLKKLLEAEPDNLRVLTRLAELALATNQPGEAAAAFRNAAEQLHHRGNHAEAIKFADRVLKLDPKDARVLVIKARAMAASGHASAALSQLASLPELDRQADAAEFLIELYLQEKQIPPAIDLATKLFARNSSHAAPLRQVAAKVLEDEDEPGTALPLINLIRPAMAEKGEHDALVTLLRSASERMPERAEPREWLVELYKQTSDSVHLPEALAELAAVYKTAGDRKRTLEIYEEILERNPDNDRIREEYEKLQGKTTAEKTKPAEPIPAHTPKIAPIATDRPVAPQKTAASAAPPEPPLDEETQRYVTQALTDIDLFSSYGLTQKAIDLLETLLQRVPGHTPTLERLLDQYLGAGDEKRTAELAAKLERIHTERGNAEAAERFGDLRRRFEKAAPAAQTALRAEKQQTPEEFSVTDNDAPEPVEIETETAAPAQAAEVAASPSAVHELDLSEEWAALATEVDAPVDETTDAPIANPQMHISEKIPGKSSRHSVPPVDVEGFDAPAQVRETHSGQPKPKPGPKPGPSKSTPNPDYVLELETANVPVQNAGNGSASAKDLLEALSSDLEAALPPLAASVPVAQPEKSAPTVKQAAATDEDADIATEPSKPEGPLGDIFEQFRSEVGEVGAEDEDLETHYNLGIAYREMGLIEEAISEFQKVAKGNSRGQAFRYAMQCCTLLGLAFMEKGQPAIAATWYERALAMPGLDQETTLALRYDLGVAQELAGDTAAARKSFSQVYGMNIDYRDVAERLSSLGNEN